MLVYEFCNAGTLKGLNGRAWDGTRVPLVPTGLELLLGCALGVAHLHKHGMVRE